MSVSNFLIKRATYMSVVVSLIIVLIKLLAWYYTDSPTIFASFTDSMLDIASSLLNFVAARYSMQPPDNEHRFGHGKVEDLAVFSQSVFFVLSGVFVLGVSIKRILVPMPLEHGFFGIMVMIFSIIVTVFLISYQSYVVKKTNSRIVAADRLHYSMDLLTNLAVIISLLLSLYFDNAYIDPVFALFISFYIIFNAVKLITSAFKNLTDHEMEDKKKERVKEIILSNPKVKGFHDLKTRYSGRKPVIQFHLELDGNMSLHDAHNISEDLEQKILKVFRGADIIIHQDPHNIDEEVNFVS